MSCRRKREPILFSVSNDGRERQAMPAHQPARSIPAAAPANGSPHSPAVDCITLDSDDSQPDAPEASHLPHSPPLQEAHTRDLSAPANAIPGRSHQQGHSHAGAVSTKQQFSAQPQSHSQGDHSAPSAKHSRAKPQSHAAEANGAMPPQVTAAEAAKLRRLAAAAVPPDKQLQQQVLGVPAGVARLKKQAGGKPAPHRTSGVGSPRTPTSATKRCASLNQLQQQLPALPAQAAASDQLIMRL